MQIGFIGGGNMATALIGGLNGDPDGGQRYRFVVIEPWAESRAALRQRFPDVTIHEQADDRAHADLAQCTAIVMAVKPQQFHTAAATLAAHLQGQLVISIAAGIRCADMARWLGGHAAIVRSMPNTPALIGAGITGLYAAPGVTGAQRELAATLLGAVGASVWVEREDLLDAVTAISGSGPAYVFAFIEALERAAVDLGLDADAARQLALATFVGASRLAAQSDEAPAVLRERVTSKGGTTFAALTSLNADGVPDAIVRAARAAALRSAQLGEEFGRD